jgi:hypothetical protein
MVFFEIQCVRATAGGAPGAAALRVKPILSTPLNESSMADGNCPFPGGLRASAKTPVDIGLPLSDPWLLFE